MVFKLRAFVALLELIPILLTLQRNIKFLDSAALSAGPLNNIFVEFGWINYIHLLISKIYNPPPPVSKVSAHFL